jgi:hypothetical protein
MTIWAHRKNARAHRRVRAHTSRIHMWTMHFVECSFTSASSYVQRTHNLHLQQWACLLAMPRLYMKQQNASIYAKPTINGWPWHNCGLEIIIYGNALSSEIQPLPTCDLKPNNWRCAKKFCSSLKVHSWSYQHINEAEYPCEVCKQFRPSCWMFGK